MKKLRDIGSNLIIFITALIPVFKSCPPCPICMPKYAAIFAFFGLELSDYSHYLIPVMLISMLTSLTSMFFQIYQRKLKYYTFISALLSSLFLLISKFVFDYAIGSYIFMGALLVSVVLHHQYIGRSMKGICCCPKEADDNIKYNACKNKGMCT